MLVIAGISLYSTFKKDDMPNYDGQIINKKIATNPNITKAETVSQTNEPTETTQNLEEDSFAVIPEEMNLTLVMASFGNGTLELNSGGLITKNGIIENLSFSIGDDLEVDVFNIELAGNTFNYVVDGEEISAMIYQTNDIDFVVTISSGTYAGLRMHFTGSDRVHKLEEDIILSDEG